MKFTEEEIDMFRRVILRYQKRNPKEWEEWLKIRNQLREQLKDPVYGTNESDSMRHVANIPQKLDVLLRNTCQLSIGKPDYLGAEFLKLFPVFKLVDKI